MNKSLHHIEMPIRVVHLEDNPIDQDLVEALLSSTGSKFEIIHADDQITFSDALTQKADLILSDFTMPGYNGLKALQLAQEIQPTVPFIFFSGTIGEEAAINSLKKGAVDYVLKQFPDRLPAAITRALTEARERASRQSAEKKIREQAALLDKAQDAILVSDLDGTIIYWNAGATRLYGWTEIEAIGRSSDSLFRAASRNPEVGDRLLKEGAWHGESEHITKTGGQVIVQSRQTLVVDADHPLSILHINTDITEKKQLEAQFLRTQRLENLGSLAGGIAHDLNNILSPIIMAVEVIQRENQTPSDSQLLETIGTSARRGANLVKQILSFARGVEGEKTCVSLVELISEIARFVNDTFASSIVTRCEIGRDVPNVIADITQLHQVLLNLCVNARDAMLPKGGVLTIEAAHAKLEERSFTGHVASVSGDFAELKVSDTGTGMPPSVQLKIFEPFFTTKKQGQGTGLGLSTVMTILRKHGGYIDLSSRLGEGTTFSVYLPAALATHQTQSEPAPEILHGKRETILVVDDESAIIEMMCTLLEAYNYRVFTACDGLEAIEVFSKHRDEIDLVITDMAMPGMEGNILVGELRKIDPKIKIVAASGFSNHEIHEHSGSMVHAFLNKPFTTQELFATLRNVLETGCVSATLLT